jgi:hypothetical protein
MRLGHAAASSLPPSPPRASFSFAMRLSENYIGLPEEEGEIIRLPGGSRGVWSGRCCAGACCLLHCTASCTKRSFSDWAMRFGGGTQGPLWAVVLPPWPWWAPGGASHQAGWSGEARGPRGGATGGAALAFSPGRAAGAVFFQGGARRYKWLDRTGGVRPFWARKN